MKDINLLRTLIFNRSQGVYQIEHENKKNEPGKLKTILKSLRYANRKDMIVLGLSILSAFLNGSVIPLSVCFIVAPLLTVFIEAETARNAGHVNITSEIPVLYGFAYQFLILGAVTFFSAFIQILGGEIAARNIVTKIKTAYLSKMLSIEVSWYDDSQEQFVSTVTHDLEKMKMLFDSAMTNTVDVISFFFFGTICGFLVSWKLALVTLAMMLVVVMIVYYIVQASKKKGKSHLQYIRKCTKIMSELLGNTRIVAAYGGGNKEIERYNSALRMANKCGLKHATVIATGIAFNYFLLCICYLVAYYFAVRLYLLDDFNPGDIIVILGGQLMAIFNITYMISTISDLYMATDSAYRVMRFLETETSYGKSIEQCIEPDKFKTYISFRNVQFSYLTNLHTKVLRDLTLEIEPGRVTAVVGTSGAGKSTIVNLISRLYDVTSGEIIIGGVDIKKLNVSWLRNQISVVGQEPMLFDTSIEENIRFGKTTATMEDIIEAAKISYANEFIEKLPNGYGTIIGESGMKLSGGQKQRIAIARAIVRKPKLLLLDEATSALDVLSERIVQEALNNAMCDRTTLIIAHRMSTVRKADVIYAIKEGRVVEKGSHDQLMKLKGYYYSLAKIQELEEKDKVLIFNQESISREQLNEEVTPIYEGNINIEVPDIRKKLSLNMKNLKTIVVWFLAILFTIITSTFLPTFFYIFGLIFQSYTYKNDEINRLALIYVNYLLGLGAIIFFSVVLSGVMSTFATQLWLEKLQKKVFNKIVSMEIGWFDKSKNSPNQCLEILTNSPPLIESVTGDRAAQFAIFILSLLFSIAYSLYVSSSVTLPFLPTFLIFIIINFMRAKSRETDARSASFITRSTKAGTEYVQNVKTIQTLNCQNYVINKYQDMLICSNKEAIVGIVWYAAVFGFSKIYLRSLTGVCLIYGANLIVSGNILGTSVISVVNALSMTSVLAGPALILTSQYPAARQAINQLYRIANTKTSLNILSARKGKPEISGNIVFHNVVFSYPTRKNVQVLKKLNLKIEAGKMVALVGDSGSGKTTIISLLERFYFPNEGKILIDGIDINNNDVSYLRSQMGLVSQEPILFDTTIKENIIYGFKEEVTMDKIIEAAKIANIHNFIMKLPQGYDTMVGKKGSKLSGGQKQRIAIARAVLRNPKILLLDEATSALDIENEKVVQEALENASIGKTTIVIAHRLSTIRKADKIIVLQSGQVIEEGNHEQLMEKRGHYFNLLNR